MRHIWTVLINMRIHMYLWKKCNWNQWKKKYPRYIHWNNVFHRNENNFFFTEIYNRQCWHHTIFQSYHPGTFMSLALQNFLILFILSCVLKSDKLDGGVSGKKSWDFFIGQLYWVNITWILRYLWISNNLWKCSA